MEPSSFFQFQYGSNCPYIRHLPKTTVTIPNIESLSTPYLGTLDPSGESILKSWAYDLEKPCTRSIKWHIGQGS